MNDNDLIIDIGADLSGFNSALQQANATFDNMAKKLSANGKVPLTVDLKKYNQHLLNAVDSFERTKKKIEADTITAGLKFNDAELDKMTQEFIQLNEKLITEARQATDKIEGYKLKEARETIHAIEKDEERARAAAMGDLKALILKRDALRVSQEKKTQAVLSSLQKQKDDERAAYYVRRTTVLRNRELARWKRQYARIQAAQKKTLETSVVAIEKKQKKRAKSRWADSPIETIGHAFRTTALYGAMAQALFGVQNAMASVVKETARFDNSIKKTSAVLGKGRDDGLKLANTIVQVGKDYGQSFEEIEEGMLTIGRAGIDNVQQLQAATEGLAALSIITGDSMKYGAEAVSSLISVYPELTEGSKEYVYAQGEIISGTEDLINKMGAVANATRLGLEDFSTISNYALTTASAIGLTSDAYLTLAGSLSKVGLNASTIGTSIRRLNKFTDDASDAVQQFFNIVGKSQSQFKKDVRENEDELGYFAQRLADMSPKEFTQTTKDLNIQLKATATSFRKIGQNNQFAKMMAEVKEAKSILTQAGLAAEGLSTRWNRAVNTLKASMNVVVSAIIIELEKVFKSASEDGPNAFDDFAKGIETFGVFAIRIIAQITTALSGFVNLLRVSVGGLAKLAGYANKIGAKLYTHSKADISAQEEAVRLQKEKFELAKKNNIEQERSTLRKLKSQLKETHERLALRELKSELKEMRDGNAYADSLRLRADAQQKWGEEAIENAAKSQEFVNNLLEAVDKGTLSYEKAKEKMGEAAKNLPKYDAETGGYNKDGLPVVETPDQKKALLEIERYNKLLSGEYTVQKLQLEEINLKIDAQKTKQKELANIAEKTGATAKQRTGALKAQAQVLALEYDRKRMLQRLDEAGGKAAKAAGGKVAKEAERLSVFQIKVLKERVKQELILAKIKGVGANEILKLNVKQSKLEVKLTADAANKAGKLVKSKRTQLAYDKSITDLYKAQNKLKKDELALANQYSGIFEDLFSGDIGGAFEGIMEKMAGDIDATLEGVGESWSRVWSSMGTTAIETSMTIDKALSTTGWYLLIKAGIALIGSLGSTVSEAERRAAEGITDMQSESIVNSLETIESYELVGLDYSKDMMYSLRSLVSLTDTAAANIGLQFSGEDYIPKDEANIWGRDTAELLATGIKLDSASIDQLTNGVLTGTAYLTELISESSWFGLVQDQSIKETDLGAVDASVLTPVREAYLEGIDSLQYAAEAFGVTTAEFERLAETWETAASKLNFEGKSEDEISEMIIGVISKDLDLWADTLDSISGYVTEFKSAGEGTFDTITRLVTEYEALSATFDLMGFEMGGIAVGGVRMAQALADAAGGMDSFLSKLNYFIENFYSSAEQAAFKTEILQLEFVKLGTTMPTTVAGMKALINAKLLEIKVLSAEIEATKMAAEAAWLLAQQQYKASVISAAAYQLAEQTYNDFLTWLNTQKESLSGLSEEADTMLTLLPMWTSVYGTAQEIEKTFASLTDIAALQGQWMSDSLEAAELYLDAAIKQTGITGVTMGNFLEKFNSALNKDGGMEQEDFDEWSLLSDAIRSVAKILLDMLNAELGFYKDILSTIQDAYTGSLSYLNTFEKADYNAQQATTQLETGDVEGYLDTLAQQLEYDKFASITKEDYIPKFDEYILALQEVDYEAEATTDDVVTQIQITNEKLDEVALAIEKSSYQP